MAQEANPSDDRNPVEALLNDPMVRMMMAADGVSADELRARLVETGVRLSTPLQDASFGVYRYGVGIILFNMAGDVLMARRIGSTDGTWQMPQGGIEPGETPIAAALRELQEEIGTTHAEVLAESASWYRYDLPEPFRRAARHKGFDGQVQKWVALRFTGSDTEIDLKTAEPEFESWCWVSADAVPGRASPFRQALYRAVIDEFRAFACPP